jgi:hypothetical protein
MHELFLTAAAVAGALCFYLGSAGQSWLHAPWPRLPSRVAAAALMAGAICAAARTLNPAAAIFLAVAVSMASLIAFPFAGLAWTRSSTR